MKNCWTWVAVFAALFGLTAAPALAADDDDQGGGPSVVAPLTGETLLTSELGVPGTSAVSGNCNLVGPSTFTFTVTGGASGPYPGTFSETGTVILGGVPENPFAASSFESAFTINSVAGTVIGTKSLFGFEATSLGLCGTAAFPTGGANSLHFEGTVSYSATITTPTGSGTDSGQSFVNLQDSQIRGRTGFNGFAFAETFTSTAADAECDGEDQQGDCDEQGEDED
jgi:hypothetical protein